MRTSRAYLFGIGGLLMAVLLVSLIVAGQRAPAPQAQAPHFWIDPSVRTAVILEPGQQAAKKGDALLTERISGSVPNGATKATVLTDTECQPDEKGISHCLNELQVGTTKVVVQHHHNMHVVPCLTPGETINIINLDMFKQL